MSVLDDIREMAATAFAVDLRRVDADSQWVDLGADDLDVVCLIVEANERFGCGLDIAEINGAAATLPTIAALAELVARRKARAQA